MFEPEFKWASIIPVEPCPGLRSRLQAAYAMWRRLEGCTVRRAWRLTAPGEARLEYIRNQNTLQLQVELYVHHMIRVDSSPEAIYNAIAFINDETHRFHETEV